VNYGFEDPPGPVCLAVGAFFGSAMGAIGALVAFFLATALTNMLYDAMPLLPGPWRIALYLFIAGLPALAFAGIARNAEATKSARVMGVFGLTVLVVLVAGEIGGFLQLYPHRLHFYIVPAIPH
jgi:hypothetical protein